MQARQQTSLSPQEHAKKLDECKNTITCQMLFTTLYNTNMSKENEKR